MPGWGTPISSSSPKASKLMPAWVTNSAYWSGGTAPRPRATYSPKGWLIVTIDRALGRIDFTCVTSSRVSSMICSKLRVNELLVEIPEATFHTATPRR